MRIWRPAKGASPSNRSPGGHSCVQPPAFGVERRSRIAATVLSSGNTKDATKTIRSPFRQPAADFGQPRFDVAKIGLDILGLGPGRKAAASTVTRPRRGDRKMMARAVIAPGTESVFETLFQEPVRVTIMTCVDQSEASVRSGCADDAGASSSVDDAAIASLWSTRRAAFSRPWASSAAACPGGWGDPPPRSSSIAAPGGRGGAPRIAYPGGHPRRPPGPPSPRT